MTRAQVFGRSLQDLCEDGDLPAVFWSSLRFLSTNALQVPGLFTDCSEDNRKVLLMRRLYDNGQDPIKLLPAASRDPHAVAGVLKLWFSCLPEPVIPPEMYDAFLRTQRHRSPEARVAGIHAMLRQCEHRVLQVLYPLMEFLHHYRINQKQTPQLGRLLARIFAPVLLAPDDIDVDFQTDEEREAAVAVVEHMIRDYRVLFSQRKRGRPLFAPADEADGAVLAAERAERMPSAPAQPRHPLPLTNVTSGGGASSTGMRCRIPTPGVSHATATDHEPSAAQPFGAAAGPVGPSSPFTSPRAPLGGPPDWDELLGDTADFDLEDLVGQMMLSSTARLFDGGADSAEGDPLRAKNEVDAAAPRPSAPPSGRAKAETSSGAGVQQHAAATAAAKPLNSPDSHVELMGAVPTDVDDSGSERFSLELPRSPHHNGVLSPALLSPSGRGSAGDPGRATMHNAQQQQSQQQPGGGAFPPPLSGGAAANAPLDEDLYSVARGSAAAVGIGYSPRGPSRPHGAAQPQPSTADLAASPRSDAGSESGGGRPPSGQHHGQQQQPQRQQRPRDLPLAIPRLPLGTSLSDGPSSSALTGGSGSGSGRALKLSPESAARAEQRRGRRSGGSSPMESPKEGGALWQELCREDAMAAVEAAALEPLEHLTLAELNSRKAALKRQLRSLDSAFEGALGRAPAKMEKEHLRPLYVRYWRLKAAIREASQKAGQS